MGKGACITLDPTVLVPGPHSTTNHNTHGEKIVHQHNAGTLYSAVEFLDKAVDFYETGNVTKAQDAIEVTIMNLQELKSFKVSLLRAREIHVLDRGRKASVECVKTSFELSGLILLNQPISADSDRLADIANISGALAFKFCKLDLAKKAFLLSEANVLTCHGSAVAKNNIGCVYFFSGDFKNAHEAFQLSLISFQEIYQDDGSDRNIETIAEKYSLAVRNNITLVFQAQRNYQSAVLARSCLMETLANEKRNFPFQTVVAVMYNQACLCLELRNYREAVSQLEDTLSFCHKEHVADDELLEFLLLKIGAVALLIGRRTREAEMAGEKMFSSSEAKELLTSRRSSSNLSLQSVEILLDILIQQRKLEVATTFLADFVPICKQIFGSQHPRAASILFRHGYVLHLIGKDIHSKACFTESIEILTGVYGFIHPEVLKCEVALARLASHEGCFEERLLHSQRSVELLFEIYQVSYEGALKEKLIELLQSERSAVVQVEKEEEMRIKSLVSEYGVELLTVFQAKTGSVDHLNEDRVQADENQVFVRLFQVSIPKEISRKLTYDSLKNGLCLLRHGMVTHSTTFLQLALSYCEDFHDNSEHSDVCLLRAILVFPSRRRNVVETTRLLGEILTFTKRSIEHWNQQRHDEKENCLFFDDQLNFKVTLAILLPSIAELKMASEMSLAQDLYADLCDHFGSKTLNISLGEELYCSFFQTRIDCLGRTISHELISLTMAGGDILETFPKYKTHPQNEVCNIMAVSRKSTLANQSIVSPHSFIFACRTSVVVDIDVLKDIYHKTVQSVQERISMLTSLDENHAGGTKHFIVLRPIARVDNDAALIAGDLDLLPLCLERFYKQRKSQNQSQLTDFLSTQRTCEAMSSFEFHEPSTSHLLFRKLIPNVIQNQRHLGGVQVLTMSENLWTLCISNPVKARITLMCDESCIRVQIQLVSSDDGSDCQACITGSSPCNCEVIERFFEDEMNKCASLFDVHYKILMDKTRCISNMILSSVHVENKPNEMAALRDKELCMKKLAQKGYASSDRWLGKPGRRSDKQDVETGTLHYQTDRSTFQHLSDWPIGAPLLLSASHTGSCINEKTLLRETFTQTDSLSIPFENAKPETAETETQTKVLDFSECLEKEIGEGARGGIPGIDTRSCLASSSAPLDPSRKDNLLCLGYSLIGHHLPVSFSMEKAADDIHGAKEELKTQEVGRFLFELTKQSRNMRKSCCSLQLEKARCARVVQERPGMEISINNACRHDERKNEIRHTKSEQLTNEPISGTACDTSNTHFPSGTSEEMDLNVIASTNGKEEGEAQNAKERDRTEGLDNGVSETFSEMPISVTDRSFVEAQVKSDNDVRIFSAEEYPFRTGSLKNDPRGWIHTADILPSNPINMNVEVSFQTTLCTKTHSDLGTYDDKHAKSTSRVQGNDEVDIGNGESIQVRQPDIWCAINGREREQELDSFTASGGQVSEEGQNLKQHMECGASGSKSYRHDIEADGSTVCPSPIANRSLSFANKARAVEDPCKRSAATHVPTNKLSNSLNRDHLDKGTDNIAKRIQLPDPKNIVTATRGEKLLNHADGSRDETKTSYNDCFQQGARPKNSRNPSCEVHQTMPTATNESSGKLKVSPHLGLSPCFLARHVEDDHAHLSTRLQTEPWPDPVSFNNSSLPSEFTSPTWDTYCSESTSSFAYTFGNGVDEWLISEGPQRPRHNQDCVVLAAPINPSPYQVPGEHQLHGALPPLFNLHNEWTRYANNPQSVLREAANHFLPTPPSPRPQSSLNLTTTSCLMGSNCSSPCSMLGSTHAQPLISGDDAGYTSAVRRSSFLRNIPEDSVTVPQMRQSSVHDGFNQIRTQRDLRGSWETSINDENLLPKSESFIIPREEKATSKIITADNSTQTPATDSNSNESDEFSLTALEQRVAEACTLVERVLRERKELERAEKEERERRKKEEQEKNKREAKKRKERDRNEGMRAAPLQGTPQWLCEHYQRRCRVKFPCCGRLYPCHRCHNSAGTCANDECKAKEATHIECSVCKHQQEITQDAQTCARCGTEMAAYFCFICKHFTGVDKNPYHCEKCGICRIHKDRSFHCKICDVCLDKRLLGNHKCRPDSGHDECCICLEDAFSGCQILPCSHKVHKDCALAMIQNGIHKCPICRHPLYSSTTSPG